MVNFGQGNRKMFGLLVPSKVADKRGSRQHLTWDRNSRSVFLCGSEERHL